MGENMARSMNESDMKMKDITEIKAEITTEVEPEIGTESEAEIVTGREAWSKDLFGNTEDMADALLDPLDSFRDIFEGDTVNEYLSEDFSAGIVHAMCVSDLAGKLAEELGFPEDLIEEVRLAGMLHDIGKLKISPYIYGRKEDSLRIEETRYIRRHAELGEQILRKLGFSDFICESVLYHHENYDGSGYPYNLRGEQIPVGARILRVCDVFAALISDRPYRKAFDMDTAIRLLIDEVHHFDMKYFLAFQNVIHTESTIREIEEIEALDHTEARYGT